MTQSEFEIFVGYKIYPSEYEVIERVVTFHPVFRDNSTPYYKAAKLYQYFGVSIFMEMDFVAHKMISYKNRQSEIRMEVHEHKEEIRKLTREFDDLEALQNKLREEYRAW